jgi:hypothetical protein
MRERTLPRWGEHPTVRFLALVLVLLAGYNGYLFVSASSRMTDGLRARLGEKPATVNVLVTVKFPPEEFHVRLFQQVGNMRGVEGSTATLHGVTPANVRYLARHYWVRTIHLAPDGARS